MTSAAISGSAPEANPAGMNRLVVSVCAMLATIMYALDTTIASVALPHMQGSMSATQEQISWVLTSYVVASAIVTSMTGYLETRFGRRRVFLVSVIGFTIASMLCGAATSLTQIVVFRLLQGTFGAGLVPLSQAVMMDLSPGEKRGPAMALWGMGVMVGPIVGPTLGGYLTELYNWRWVFYINLPVGAVSALGILLFLPDTKAQPKHYFDSFGFVTLAIAIGGLQLILDRGHSLDWFASQEIVVEAIIAAIAFYLFIAHMFTTDKPFLRPQPFRDVNYTTGLALSFMIGLVVLATMALMPGMLQSLIGYPVATTGMLLAPRGFGTLLAMAIVSRLVTRVDTRLLIGCGFLMGALSMWQMTGFTLDVSERAVIISGAIQGFGIGMIFVPLTAVSFASLDPRFRTEGSAIFTLIRSIGSSVGISIVVTMLSRNTQINHAELVEHLTPFHQAAKDFAENVPQMAESSKGLGVLAGEVNRQATMIAYVDNFKFMMYLTLAATPLLILLRPPKKSAGPSSTDVIVAD